MILGPGRRKIIEYETLESRMWNLQILKTPPILPPSGFLTDLPCDSPDDLDAVLASRVGRTLALSDGYGTWMRPKVVPLIRGPKRPTTTLDVEFELVGHSRPQSNRIDLVIEGACGTRGELRLMWPRSAYGFPPGPRGWQLHIVGMIVIAPCCTGAIGPTSLPDPLGLEPSTPEPEEPVTSNDPDESIKRKRDDLLREMFS